MKHFKIRASAIGEIMGNAKKAGDLSSTCITYLKKWYANRAYQYKEDIRSKYFTKGNLCEGEAIAVCSIMFGELFEKNDEYFSEHPFIEGTPDVLTENLVIDTKCPWDGATFLDAITNDIDKDYEFQLHGYMELTGRKEAKLCYVLLDTPKECNYGKEVIFSNVDIEKRFFSFYLQYDSNIIKALEEKVNKCREWLDIYHETVTSLLSLNYENDI